MQSNRIRTRGSRLAIAATISIGCSALHASDKLLVSSFLSDQIERYSAKSGALIDTIDGSGSLIDPLGMTIGPDGNLYVASEGSDQVLRFHPDSGDLIDVFVAAGSGGLDNPAAVLFGGDGKLYVSSFETDAILRYDGSTGAFLDVFVTSASGGLDGPDAGMVFGPGGDLFVPSFWSDEVLRYSGADGSFLGAFVTAGSGGLASPRALHFRASDGNLLVTSEASDSVLLYDGATGAPISTLISSISGPSGMAFGPDGNLYITSIGSNSVQRFAADGTFIDVFVNSISLPTFLIFNNDGSPDFTQQEQFGSGSTIPVAWGDANGDGFLDLAVGNYFAEQEQLYWNNGIGGFTGEAAFDTHSTFALAWGDCDNDGDLDLALGRGDEAENGIYINDGDSTFSQNAAFGALTTVAVAWADFDNDGDLDLAVGNGILASGDQQNRLYVNNGDCTFVGHDEFGTAKTDSVAWGDFDNDGDMDLAVGNGGFNSNQQNMLYENKGDGSFDPRMEFGVGNTASIAWGDLNNDGFLDLAVANWSDGQNRLYLNNGDGTFAGSAAFGARDTNTITMGDFNNDGHLDVAVGNGDFTSADQNYLYMNLGDAVFAEFPAFGLGSTDSLAFADFDNDGDLDMAVGNEHTPPTNYLFVNNQDDDAYLIIHLVGHRHDLGAGYSNRNGIGARVSVYEAGHMCDSSYLLGMREIEAPGGFTSQGSLDAEFGVPGHATVDVRIDWPGSDGQAIVQELAGIPTGQKLVVDEQDISPDVDCNANGFSDVCDVGLFGDCNSNGVPDECDIAGPTSDDCTANGIPDECEPDCNNTGVADSCDILEGTSSDCSGNEIPDECEPDCNDTGVADSCDIVEGTSPDCNSNEVPDECDIAGPTSNDVNGNGIPDECDLCPPSAQPNSTLVDTGSGLGNRTLVFETDPADAGRSQAIRVVFTDLAAPYDIWNGKELWVQAPSPRCENATVALPPCPGGEVNEFLAAALGCTPFYANWSSFSGPFHAYHEGIVPNSLYSVDVIEEGCVVSDPASYSPPLLLTTSRFGDVCSFFTGVEWPQPDGGVDIVADVLAVLAKFSASPTAPISSRTDLEPRNIDWRVNISDVLHALNAFSGFPYPYEPSVDDPCPLAAPVSP